MLAHVVGLCTGFSYATIECTAFYDARTDFTGAQSGDGEPFDPVGAGWTFVPEPGTALLLGLGLIGLVPLRDRARRSLDAKHERRAAGCGVQPAGYVRGARARPIRFAGRLAGS